MRAKTETFPTTPPNHLHNPALMVSVRDPTAWLGM
jgi:hypothetical protein